MKRPKSNVFLSVAAIVAGMFCCGGAGAAAQASASQAAATQAPAQNSSNGLTSVSPKDVLGIWQGTLHAGRDLRTEIKITQAGAGEYKATLYSIDQGGQPIGANKTTFESGVLTYSIDAINGKYEGKMSADGKTIVGTWTQGPNSLALTLERTTPDNAWPIPEPIKPMAADAHPTLEVATIKPTPAGRPGKLYSFQGSDFKTYGTDMNDLIAFAYGLQAKQIIGAPDWFTSDAFDIDGKPDVPGRPSLKQESEMIQKLLADRCALKFHHEQRELSVYAIRVASGGPKMTKSTAGPDDPSGFGLPGFG